MLNKRRDDRKLDREKAIGGESQQTEILKIAIGATWRFNVFDSSRFFPFQENAYWN